MQKIVYVPSGGEDDERKRVVLAAEEPFILTAVTGVGGVEADMIGSAAAGTDGEYYQSCRRAPRVVRCTVNVSGENREDMYEKRLKLIGMLTQSEQPGTLYYQNDCISVKALAVPQIPPDFVKRIKNYNEAEIAFYCPSPDWIGREHTEAVACDSDTSGLCIKYWGTVSTPVFITVRGATGKLKLTNEASGKTIALKKVLKSGETLYINTEKGNKRVVFEKDGETENGFGYLEADSELWKLTAGSNPITIEGATAEETEVSIRYSERYSGV